MPLPTINISNIPDKIIDVNSNNINRVNTPALTPYDAPCKDCPERILKCHSSCIKYALYKNNIEAYKSMENINKAFYAYIAEHYRRIASK